MQKQCSVVLLVLILELEGHGREKTEEAAWEVCWVLKSSNGVTKSFTWLPT